MAKYLYNQEAVENLRLSDTSILDRLVDFESAREAHLKKEHAKKDKRMTIGEAVATYVQDGDILTDGGFHMFERRIRLFTRSSGRARKICR